MTTLGPDTVLQTRYIMVSITSFRMHCPAQPQPVWDSSLCPPCDSGRAHPDTSLCALTSRHTSSARGSRDGVGLLLHRVHAHAGAHTRAHASRVTHARAPGTTTMSLSSAVSALTSSVVHALRECRKCRLIFLKSPAQPSKRRKSH